MSLEGSEVQNEIGYFHAIGNFLLKKNHHTELQMIQVQDQNSKFEKFIITY